MVTVETTIKVSIADEGMSLEQLEAAVGEVVRDAGQALLLAGCQAIETQALARASSELRPDKRRAVDLLTRFGWIRLERWQMQEAASGRYCRPLDAILKVERGQHASPWTVDTAVALATRLPYRPATDLLSRLIGAPV